MLPSYPVPGNLDTFPKLLCWRAREMPDEIAMRRKDFGIWHEYTWADYQRQVAELAVALSERGLGRGDVFAMIGRNNPWWASMEVAAQAAGCMTLGLYRDGLDEEVGYLARYAAIKGVFAEDQEQVDKFLNLGDSLPALELILYEQPRGLSTCTDPRVLNLEKLLSEGRALLRQDPRRFEALAAQTKGEDVAILCATSGTTADPKLAMLQGGRFINHTLRYLEADPKDHHDEYVSILPYPWIMEQVYGIGFSLISGMKVNFPENEDTAMHDMREIGPTFMLGAPRLFEQIAADLRVRIMDASRLNQWIFHIFLKRGLARLEQGKRDRLSDAILFSALRDRLGFSRVRSMATGGSAIGPDTLKFFLALGMPLRQLYGQTELAGAYTLQKSTTTEIDCDTVGKPFSGVEVKIKDPDANGLGEILTRHPNMFVGYYNNQEAYAADLKDGWLHSGDVGYFDSQGRLVVVDRLKDMAEMTNGSHFSPQYLENKLKFSAYIAEALVLGRGQEYLSAIICIRYSVVSKWAEKRQITFTSYTSLAAHPEVYSLLEEEVRRVNQGLPQGTRIRKFMLLFKELDADDGELTRTRKVRRALCTERYQELVKSLYSEAKLAQLDTELTYEDGRKVRVQAEMEIRAAAG